jgi:hypothetical protein
MGGCTHPPTHLPHTPTGFQQAFNALETDMRFEEETKAELHLRNEELRDALWKMVRACASVCTSVCVCVCVKGHGVWMNGARPGGLRVLHVALWL